ncbi:MAG: hypothetical protein CM15mP31_2190 [Gammaproteobacteria bacterium]|nr:MAG: hypothetical protein CM15mP31_2190 [Gammaproteobacteria bacterium]
MYREKKRDDIYSVLLLGASRTIFLRFNGILLFFFWPLNLYFIYPHTYLNDKKNELL